MYKPSNKEKRSILRFHGVGVFNFLHGYPRPGSDRPRRTRHAGQFATNHRLGHPFRR